MPSFSPYEKENEKEEQSQEAKNNEQPTNHNAESGSKYQY